MIDGMPNLIDKTDGHKVGCSHRTFYKNAVECRCMFISVSAAANDLEINGTRLLQLAFEYYGTLNIGQQAELLTGFFRLSQHPSNEKDSIPYHGFADFVVSNGGS